MKLETSASEINRLLSVCSASFEKKNVVQFEPIRSAGLFLALDVVSRLISVCARHIRRASDMHL